MAEIINLATFNLDTSSMLSNLEKLQDAYFDLKKEQKSFSDQSKETAKQISLLEKTQESLTNASGDNSEAIDANKKEIEALLKTQRELFKSEQNIATQMSTVRKEINLTTTQVKAYQDAEGRTRSLIDLGNEALTRQIKNKNDARAANAALNSVANQLNPNIEEENKLLIQLNAQIDKNTNFVRSNSSDTAKQAMNIGNYSSALERTDGILAKFGINGQEARDIVNDFSETVTKVSEDLGGYADKISASISSLLGFTTATEASNVAQETNAVLSEEQAVANVALATTTEGVTVATTASTIGIKAFTIALASTGIGLIVIALGSLISYFTNTQAGADKLTAVLEPLKAVFSGILSIASGLGEKLVSAFSNPKKALSELYEFVKGNLINRFTAFSVILDGIINLDFKKVTNGVLQAGTGVENLTDKIANGAKAVGKFLDENAVKGAKIATINRQIAREQLAYEKNQVAVNDALDEQLLISKDTSKSFAERAKAANNIIAISEKNGQAEKHILELEMKRLKIQQSIKGEKNLTNEERRAEIELIAKIDEADDRGQQARLEQMKVLSGLKKEQAEQNKKLAEDETNRLLQNSKEQIDLFIAKQGFAKKSAEEERKINKELQSKLEADAKLRFQKGKLSKTAYETELLNIGTNFAKKDLDLVTENAELEAEIQRAKNKKILDDNKFLSEQQYQEKQKALKSDYDLEVAHQRLLFDSKLINQQELDLALETLKLENQAKNDALTEERKVADQEKQLIDLENQKIIDEENFIAQGELDKERNAIKLEQELANAEKTGADTQLIKDKYAKMDKDIDNAVMQNKLSLASQTFGQLATILGENSKAGKAAAIAQATIDTYSGINKVWSTASTLPEPLATGQKILSTVIVAKSGFDSVKKITATKSPDIKRPNYATGVIGLRGAGDGTSDSVTANLSAGESVINARSTAMFANELSAINQLGGGVGINGSSNILNQNNLQSSANNSQLASMIAEAVAIGAEAGTSKGAQSGITKLSDNRKIMNDAKF